MHNRKFLRWWLLVLFFFSCTSGTGALETDLPIQTSTTVEAELEQEKPLFVLDIKELSEGWTRSTQAKDTFQIVDTSTYEEGVLQISLPNESDYALRFFDRDIQQVQIEATLAHTDSNYAGLTSLFCHYQDGNNTYQADWERNNAGDASFTIKKIVKGSPTILNSSEVLESNNILQISPLGEPGELRINGKKYETTKISFVCHDSHLVLYVNDVLRIVAQDDELSGGKAGLGLFNNNQTQTQFVLTELVIDDITEITFPSQKFLPLLAESDSDHATLTDVCSFFSNTPPYSNGFTTTCQDSAVIITPLDSEGTDFANETYWGIPIVADAFVFEADITSYPAVGEAKDLNSYGLFVAKNEDSLLRWQIQASYYHITELSLDSEILATADFNKTHSPSFSSARRMNHLKLVCQDLKCEYWVNEDLIAKTRTLSSTTQSIGIFSQKALKEPFGSIKVENIKLSIPLESDVITHTFSVQDDLQTDKGTFSNIGLSGAFSKFGDDGFHFSPVIAYGYYGVKNQPALQDMSVSVDVQLNPQHSSQSMYGGLTCRASLDGSYIAVIRNNGRYSIYRDTPKRPFTLLAEKTSEFIFSDGSPNSLMLICEGNNIRFYINGQLVEDLEDTRTLLNFGRAGLFTKGGQSPHEDAIVFSNFHLEEIN